MRLLVVLNPTMLRKIFQPTVYALPRQVFISFAHEFKFWRSVIDPSLLELRMRLLL